LELGRAWQPFFFVELLIEKGSELRLAAELVTISLFALERNKMLGNGCERVPITGAREANSFKKYFILIRISAHLSSAAGDRPSFSTSAMRRDCNLELKLLDAVLLGFDFFLGRSTQLTLSLDSV